VAADMSARLLLIPLSATAICRGLSHLPRCGGDRVASLVV